MITADQARDRDLGVFRGIVFSLLLAPGAWLLFVGVPVAFAYLLIVGLS